MINIGDLSLANDVRFTVYCANCSEKIMDDPLKQAGDYFCSEACANQAQRLDPDDPLVYEFGEIDQDFLEYDEDELFVD